MGFCRVPTDTESPDELPRVTDESKTPVDELPEGQVYRVSVITSVKVAPARPELVSGFPLEPEEVAEPGEVWEFLVLEMLLVTEPLVGLVTKIGDPDGELVLDVVEEVGIVEEVGTM